MAWTGGGFEFAEYVSVAERRERARKIAEKLGRKRGSALTAVGPLQGRGIVRTFWGKAWCDNLASYSDYANRLGRGRSYVRHGAVIDLQITSGKVSALVVGSSTYETTITIRSLEHARWQEIAGACTGKIDSLIDLLKGNLSAQVMEIVTRRERGLFPAPGQISLDCSCPDWADMCKHIAAVLYGVGVRLDERPEMLFTLRGVDHADLIGRAAEEGVGVGIGLTSRATAPDRKVVKDADLSALFGIEIEATPPRSTNAARQAGHAPLPPLVPGTADKPTATRRRESPAKRRTPKASRSGSPRVR